MLMVIAMETPLCWQILFGEPSHKLVGFLAIVGLGLGLAFLQMGVALLFLERWVDAYRGLDTTRYSVVS